MAAPPPTAAAIKSLYHNMLRSSQSFSSYNFREYFLRRTREGFREMQSEPDPSRLSTLYAAALRDSAVMRRSAIVNQLFGGPKLAVELQDSKVESGAEAELKGRMEGEALERGLERGNN